MWNRENSTEEVLEATLAAFSAHPEHPDFVWLRAESLRLRQPRDEAIAFLEDNALLASSPELLNVRASALFDKALDDRLDAAKREAALEAFAHSRRVKVFEVRGVIKDMDREYSERIDMMRSDATS